METLFLEAQNRAKTGSANGRRTRREGLIPGNIYGHKQSHNITIVYHDLEMLRRKMHSEHAVIKIKKDGEELDVLVKHIQRHQVTHKIIHVDFLVIDLDETVKITVSIEPVGEPDGVKNHGGVLELIRREVEIECKAGDIPSAVQVDVSHLGIHEAIRIEDLPEVAGVTYINDPKLTVITVASPTIHEEETTDEVDGEETEAVEPELVGGKGKEEEKED